MIHILFKCVFVIVVLCGRSVDAESASERIPYMASIMYQGRHHCAGAILNKRWIVSVAQCLNDPKLEELEVIVGTNDLDKPGQTFSIKSFKVYPDGSDNLFGYTHNLALLKLNGSIKFDGNTQSISLPNAAVYDGEDFDIYGWFTRYDQQQSNFLQHLEMTHSEASCRENNYGHKELLFCIFDKTGDITENDIFSDTGNPVVKDNKLDGISYAVFPDRTGKWGMIAIRVHLFLKEIKKTIKE